MIQLIFKHTLHYNIWPTYKYVYVEYSSLSQKQLQQIVLISFKEW